MPTASQKRRLFPNLTGTADPFPSKAVTGVLGNQIFLFPASDLAVVVSEHDPAEATAEKMNQQAQKDHARVISDCFKLSTVLPFRFNTVFQDDDACAARSAPTSATSRPMSSVCAARPRCTSSCWWTTPARARCRGVMRDCVGKEYLTSLRESASRQRERQSRARALSVQMHRMFLPLAEEITCKRTDSGKMLLDIAHLIDHKCVERYQNKYSTATLEMKDCRMQLSGPWPPYHFVQRHQTA